jgi:sugar phosphate isomerase/epimerase
MQHRLPAYLLLWLQNRCAMPPNIFLPTKIVVMTISRRKFIGNGSLSLAATLLLPRHAIFAANKGNIKLGVQLYSVRDDMKKDPLGSLQQIAAMGYTHVEHANYVEGKFYGYTPKAFKTILDDLGLKMPSGHTVLSGNHWNKSTGNFTDSWQQTITDAAIVGQQFVISPWLDESLRKDEDGLKGFLNLFNKSGELCKKSGLQFGYHNHDFEFNTMLNGKMMYDIILDYTDPALVMQQIDIGNMYGAGGRALEVLKKYPGRFASMHVKDEIKVTGKGEMGTTYESTVLGEGLLPVKKIIDEFKTMGGTTDFIVEQESYQGKTPMEAVKKNLAIMKKWGY